MENLFILTAVAGFVELTKALFDKNFRTAVIILGAAFIGGLTGYFHLVAGVDLTTGIILGLGSSGVVTIAKKMTY